MSFTVEPIQDGVVTIRMDDISAGWSQSFLLRSDAHHDNLLSDHAMEKKHLDRALALGAGILDFGDLGDLMQGKTDPRAEKSEVPEALRLAGNSYINAVLDYNADFYLPYVRNWALLAPGNHESKFSKVKEFDYTPELAKRFQAAGSPVQAGDYQGWVRFMFRWNGTKQKSYRLWYHHGFGGGGKVSKGVPQTYHQMASLANPDFIVSGHTHSSYWVTEMRETLDTQGRKQEQCVECLRCPGYKKGFVGNGWATEVGHGPKPRGAWMLRFFLEDDTIDYEITKAK